MHGLSTQVQFSANVFVILKLFEMPRMITSSLLTFFERLLAINSRLVDIPLVTEEERRHIQD